MKNHPKRVSYRARRTGFTLIELLTVIAIISVLAGISIVAVPQYLEKAKITQTISNADHIVQGLSEYSARTDNIGGYPPAYGYVLLEARDKPVATLVDTDHMLQPYTVTVGIHENQDVYQVSRWANSFDSNRDGSLSLMEYLPVGEKDPATGTYLFSTTLYDGGNSPMSGAVNEVIAQLDDRSRPFAYIPFNSAQLRAARRYWATSIANGGVNEIDTEATGGTASFDTSHAFLTGRMFFPPPKYDGFVLIGSGIGGTDGGLTSIPIPGNPGVDYDARHVYHVLGLRIAFLATQDLDNDGKLDFDFRPRKAGATPAVLPDGTRGFGAFIEVVQ